jgi:hypothetical protein
VTRVDARHPGKAANGASHRESEDTSTEEGTKADASERASAWRVVRGLPHVAEAAVRTSPLAVATGVGAAAFLVGAVCGSRVGRHLVTSLAGYGLRRLIEGPLATALARFAADMMRRAAAPA